jgi:hypothetical protein
VEEEMKKQREKKEEEEVNRRGGGEFMTHSYEHGLTQLMFKLTKIKMSLHTFLTSA